jgi:hypothetical protein
MPYVCVGAERSRTLRISKARARTTPAALPDLIAC